MLAAYSDGFVPTKISTAPSGKTKPRFVSEENLESFHSGSQWTPKYSGPYGSPRSKSSSFTSAVAGANAFDFGGGGIITFADAGSPGPSKDSSSVMTLTPSDINSYGIWDCCGVVTTTFHPESLNARARCRAYMSGSNSGIHWITATVPGYFLTSANLTTRSSWSPSLSLMTMSRGVASCARYFFSSPAEPIASCSAPH